MRESFRLAIVDDDPLFLRAIHRAHARAREDVELALLPSGYSAIEHVRDGAVDMIIVDVYMPGMDGLQACRRLREVAGPIPIGLASIDMTAELRRAALASGASFALTKPYDLDQLRVLRRRATKPWTAKLITSHLGAALNIAAPLARSFRGVLAWSEVESLAWLGLCEAAARFDPARPEPFVAFAERRIRGAVLDEVRKRRGLSRGAHARLREIGRASDELNRDGKVADPETIATRLGITATEVNEMRAVAKLAFVELRPDWPSSEPSPDTIAERTEALQQLVRARQTLSPLERALIEQRYQHGASLSTIARSLGLDRATARRLHTRVLAKLRRALARAS